MLSSLAPLRRPGQFSGILCIRNRFAHRNVSRLYRRGLSKPWTADEDSKLMELRRQGTSMQHIAKEMIGRTFMAIETRIMVLNTGKVSQKKKDTSRSPIWTPEENALLLEKLQQGLLYRQIASFFPGRTYHAVTTHLQNRERWASPQSRRYQRWTDAELQRIIDMRTKEAKTLTEIAAAFNCTFPAIAGAWRLRCERLISKEAHDSIQRQTLWTPIEEEHLQELHRREKEKMHVDCVALHFPSKTTDAVRNKCRRMGLGFARRRRKPEHSP